MEGLYLMGHDVSSCKCGQGDYTVKSYFVQTTRYIENDMNSMGDMAWSCEQCKDARIFNEFHPRQCDFNFCPTCGRKITEFVDYVEDLSDDRP